MNNSGYDLILVVSDKGVFPEISGAAIKLHCAALEIAHKNNLPVALIGNKLRSNNGFRIVNLANVKEFVIKTAENDWERILLLTHPYKFKALKKWLNEYGFKT